MRQVLFIIFFLFCLPSFSQQSITPLLPGQQAFCPIDSSKGFYLPAFDTVKTLIIFTKFKEDELPGTTWPVNATKVPAFASNLICTDGITVPPKSLTQYFQEASLGRLFFWGSIYPRVITLDSSIAWYNQNYQEGSCHQEIFRKLVEADNVNWAEFDNWSKQGKIHQKKPDGVIDNIIIIYRKGAKNFGYNWIGGVGGVAALFGPDFRINEKYQIKTGSMESGLLVNNGGDDQFTSLVGLIKHELAHFFTQWHYGATNDQYGPGIVLQGSWGLAAASGSSSICVNAWDRYFLGWAKPKFDLSPDKKNNGTYTLKDFLTTGEMMRIQLPHVSNQYFWLEYHNNTATYDNVDSMKNGLFIFHQLDETGPHHLMLEQADGRYDYCLTDSGKIATKCCGMHYQVRRLEENPLLGYFDRSIIKLDENKDGIFTEYKDPGNIPMLAIEGEKQFIHYEGDGQDGYTEEQGRNEFGINTNPSTASEGSLRSNGKSALNGIRIKVIKMNNDQVEFSIAFNDFNLKTDTRWCGRVELYDSLVVKKRKTLLLNRSQTFDKLNAPFPEAELIVKEGGSITLEKKARLDLEDESTLILEGNSKIYLSKKSKINVSKKTKISAAPTAIRKIK